MEELCQSAAFDDDGSHITTDPYANPALKARQQALGYLFRAEITNPLETLIGIYNRCLPKEPKFADEVRAQEAGYLQSRRMKAYLKAMDVIAGDDYNKYVDLYRQGRTEDDRQRLGGELYASHLAEIPPFQAPTPEQYLDRFTDYPMELHEKVRLEAYELAKTHTLSLPPRSSTAVTVQSSHQQPEEPIQH